MQSIESWSDVHVPLPSCDGMEVTWIAAVMQQCERISREVAAAHAALISAIGVRGRDTPAFVARSTGVSRAEAFRRKRVAEVIEAFPRAGELLAQGEIASEHVAALHDAIEFEGAEQLVDLAVGRDPKSFRDLVIRFMIGPLPADDAQMSERQRVLRSVTFRPAPGGMMAMRAVLQPTDGAMIRAALEKMCTSSKIPGSTPGRSSVEPLERRLADVLVAFFQPGNAAGPVSVRPSVVLTVDLGSGDAEIVGQGPVTNREAIDFFAKNSSIDVFAARLRPDGSAYRGQITKSSELAKLLRSAVDSGVAAVREQVSSILDSVDPRALDSRPSARDPTLTQRMAVILRDRHCVVPGCTADHTRCDAHHLLEWENGGPTIVENLAVVCRAHHHWLHATGRALVRGPGGRYAVISTDNPPDSNAA